MQRDGVVGLALELVALAREHHQREVVASRARSSVPSTSIVTSSPRSNAAATAAGSSCCDRARDGRHAGAEARPELPEVGLHLVRGQLLRLLHVGDPLHVQLLEHLVLEPLDRRALARIGDDDGLAQRLAHLHVGLAACRAAELHRAARDRHVELELAVDQCLVGLREVAQVHGRLGAVEVAVDLVRDERRERRQQLRHRHERVVQREVGRRRCPRRPPPPLRQKRRRLRRTYQLERSSTKVAIERPAEVVS